MRSRHAQIIDRNARRKRALLAASELADTQRIKDISAGLALIEARIRADNAVNEQVKRLESIAKALGYRPKVTVREVETPVFVAEYPSAEQMVYAFRRRGFELQLE